MKERKEGSSKKRNKEARWQVIEEGGVQGGGQVGANGARCERKTK